MKIYLAGACDERRQGFCHHWRDDTTKILERKKGITVINPLDYFDFGSTHTDIDVVETDLDLISDCDAIIAEVGHIRDYPYIGTSMEIFHAFNCGVPVFVWSEINNYFLSYHASYISNSLGKVVKETLRILES